MRRAVGGGSYADAAAAQGRQARVGGARALAREERGGSTRYTGSWFRVTEDRQLDPKFVETMERSPAARPTSTTAGRSSASSRPRSRFLEEHGVEYIYFKQGSRTATPAAAGHAGGQRARHRRRARRRPRADEGVDLVYETEAIRLSVSDEGRVDGVVVRAAGRPAERTLHARAVVIASGGFEGNKEMLTQYLGERACDIPVISPGTGNNRGEGIRMAIEVGADTAGQFDMFHAEPIDPRATKPDPVIYPYPYGIVVNRHAKRFFDEGKNSFDSTFEELGYEIWRNQEQTAFLIGDQTSLSVNGFQDVIFTDVPPDGRHVGSWREARARPGGARGDGRRVQRRDRTRRVRPVQLRRQEHGRARPAQVELGVPARLAAVLRLSAHLRDLLHLRRHPDRPVGPRREPVGHTDSRPLCGGRGDRALLPRVPGRHVGDPRRHVRAASPARTRRRAHGRARWTARAREQLLDRQAIRLRQPVRPRARPARR